MNRFTTAAKVGLFAIVTVVAGFFIFKFVSKRTAGTDGYVVWALFNDATGVPKNSQVKVAGIPIGQVESIRLQDGKARIDIRIRADVPLYEDAAVAKVSSSLLGEYFLAVAPGTEGKPQLQNGDRINAVVEAATTDQIFDNGLHETILAVIAGSQTIADAIARDYRFTA